MSTGQSIRQAIFGVSGVVLISKFSGFIREMVIAERFGTTSEYDVFLIAIAVPIFFNVVVVRSVNFLSVPFLTRQLSETDKIAGKRNIWSVYNSNLMVVITICLAVIALAPQLVRLISENLSATEFSQGVIYCRLATLLILLSYHESFLRSALNVKKHFAYPIAGIIINNVVIITLIYIFSGRLSVGAILLGLLTGVLVQNIFLLLRLWNVRFFGFFNLKLFNKTVRHTLSAGATIITIEMLMRAFFIIDRYYAADMTAGVVSALNYCSLLVMLPVSVVGYAIAAVTFPYLSERTGPSHRREFSDLLKKSLSLSLTIAVPAGIFYFIFAEEITAAVFLRGAFDLTSLRLTSEILITLAPYLICQFIYTILIQAHFSAGLERRVLYTAIMAVILKLILTGIFSSILDYPGIGLATSTVFLLTVSILVVSLIKTDRLRNVHGLAILLLKLVLASLPILVVGYFYQDLSAFAPGMNLLSKMRVIWAAPPAAFLFILAGYGLKVDIIRQAFKDLLTRKEQKA